VDDIVTRKRQKTVGVWAAVSRRADTGCGLRQATVSCLVTEFHGVGQEVNGVMR